MAFQVQMTCKDGVVRPDFRRFQGDTPKQGEVIEIQESGNIIKARVTRVLSAQPIDLIEVVET